jgi:hypothetical protein
MSWVSLKSDSCSYQEKLGRSVGPGMYMLATPANDCNECGRDIPADPTLRFQTYGPGLCPVGGSIDTGSELRGLNYKNTKCSTEQFEPSKYVDKGGVCKVSGTQAARKCTATQEASRLSNPPCTLRSTGWNRWEWLCHDPQQRAAVPFNYLVSNRIMVKDNHVPYLPTPQNHSNSLEATKADPLNTLPGWKPVPGTGAEPPGNAPNNQSYRSCEWAKAVNGY